MKHAQFSAWLLFASLICVPQAVLAVDLTPLKVPIIQGGDLIGVLGRLVDFVLLWGGIVAFFYALWGGYQYLASGGDNTGADKGKKTLTNAIIGIIIIAISYVTVNYLVTTIGSGFKGVPNAGTTVTEQAPKADTNTTSGNQSGQSSTGQTINFPASGATITLPGDGATIVLPDSGTTVSIPQSTGTALSIPGPGGSITLPGTGTDVVLPLPRNTTVSSTTASTLYKSCTQQGAQSNAGYGHWANLCYYLIYGDR